MQDGAVALAQGDVSRAQCEAAVDIVRDVIRGA